MSPPAHRNGHKPFGGHTYTLWRDDERIVQRRSRKCLAPFLESLDTKLPHEGALAAVSEDEEGNAPSPSTFGETIQGVSKDDR